MFEENRVHTITYKDLVFKTLGTLHINPSAKVPAAEVTFDNGFGLTIQKFSANGRDEFYCQVVKKQGDRYIPLLDEKYYPAYRGKPDYSCSYGGVELVEKCLQKVQAMGG